MTTQHYQHLVKALRKKAGSLSKEESLSRDDDCNIAESLIIQESENSAWLVLRLTGEDSPLLLLHGVSTIPLARLNAIAISSKAPLPFEEVAKQGAGIEISVVPWDQQILPVMQILAQNAENAFKFCRTCGHEKPPLPEYMHKARLAECPGCGDQAY